MTCQNSWALLHGCRLESRSSSLVGRLEVLRWRPGANGWCKEWCHCFPDVFKSQFKSTEHPRHGSERWQPDCEVMLLNCFIGNCLPEFQSWKLPIYSGKRIPQEAGALEKLSLYFKLLPKEPQAVFWHLFSCSGYCTASHPCLLILFPLFPTLFLVVSTTYLWRMWQTRCQNWSALAATQRECRLKKIFSTWVPVAAFSFLWKRTEQNGLGWLNIAYILYPLSD